ncbi:MAG: hypothetical protein L3J24_05175 [Xanthomonadales bacterium]|nr:hypothetical protein [Xanthomonadales bacterium]
MRRIILISLLFICNTAMAGLIETSFTYQGELQVSNMPANGQYDLTFELFDADSGGLSVAGLVTLEDIIVTDGIFTTELDFGASAFAIGQLWMEISVRDGASIGGFQSLLPRQKLTATPYALHAEMVALDAIGSSEIADGSITGNDIASNSIDSTNIVDGPGSNLNADLLDGSDSSDFASQADLVTNTSSIADLQAQITSLAAQGSPPPTVIGFSSQSSNGSFSFGGETGSQAANLMCISSFPANSNAHFCSVDEVERAVTAGNIASSVNNQETWTIYHNFNSSGSTSESTFNTCQGLLKNVSDLGNGITLTILLNQTPPGSGTVSGDRVNLRSSRQCNSFFPVMCCG